VSSQLNNKRIAKNTLMLYFRMLLMMGVSLYTSRVVLNALGIEDFGIYNVVGGVIAMFSFINSSMSSATQRFLTFELGQGNSRNLKKVFNTSLIIHWAIAFGILILGETIGLWFFYNKMTIPVDRFDAAMWVYQISIIVAIVNIVNVPYNALIIAHERMNVFAYISIAEVLFKLAIVYVLYIVNYDKLTVYVILILSVSIILRVYYQIYCRRSFSESKFYFEKDVFLIKKMAHFAGWNLIENIAGIISYQGLNLLLNVFFNPMVNAARAVAVQVNSAIFSFSNGFQTALNPQITKSYAAKDFTMMHSLIFKSSKFSFFILYFLSVPVLLNADIILRTWLKIVPEYSNVFVRLVLCTAIIGATGNSFMIAAQATGNIRKYQIIVGGTLLLVLPVSYICLRLGGNPVSVFIVQLVVDCLMNIARFLVVKPMIKLSLRSYFREVLLKIIIVVGLSFPLAFFVKYILQDGVVQFLAGSVLSMLFVAVSIFFFGLTKHERQFLINKILAVLSRHRSNS